MATKKYVWLNIHNYQALMKPSEIQNKTEIN